MTLPRKCKPPPHKMPPKMKHECDPRTRCCVKDIQRVHGVAIPLHVFQNLNVASCWTDWVDGADIELAMWAHGLAKTTDDIDTK